MIQQTQNLAKGLVKNYQRIKRWLTQKPPQR